MAKVQNILVGAARLFLGRSEGVQPAIPNPATPGLYATAMTSAPAATDWRDVGFTTAGLAIAYTPTYGDVTVDQLKDSALLFASALTIEATTELAEATLQNLQTVWGQHDTSLTTGANPDVSGNVDEIGVAGGALGDYPVERSLLAIGNAPRTTVPTTKRERVYLGRRVVSVSASTHSLVRDGATTFPVTFRLLPDPSYSGTEYGRIIDRTV